MSGQVSTALAHLVLAITSAWAISQSTDYSYACVGFVLYTINGLLGALTYGLALCSLQLYNIYSQCLLLALSFGLPLFVSQLYINAGVDHSLALVHFILPLAYIFSGRNLKRDHLFLLESLQMIYIAFLLYISLTNGYYFGLSAAVSFGIGFCVFGTTGTFKNTPAQDLFNYAMSFSVFFLIQTLKDK